jgi:endonuclease/exonuclease/phosphatase (EEP) superfamily protein YafD
MVSIMAANVLQTNNSFGKFIDIINDMNPDLVLAMETNKAWEENLSEIEKNYPHSVKIPLENFYGMLLYSKHELHNVSIQFQIEETVPSIFFEYAINETQNIFVACLHPAPPSPTENETSKERDAELMLTGKHIQNIEIPVVVCGDMNDVVWSRVTRIFKKMTNMIDPRIGRGFFPTYHAGYRFMRFPLDHLFHSKDLFVSTMKRTPNFDSDHFGMYYEIHFKKKVVTTTNGDMDKDDKEFVEELIDRS